jgi:hypothetical protein
MLDRWLMLDPSERVQHLTRAADGEIAKAFRAASVLILDR